MSAGLEILHRFLLSPVLLAQVLWVLARASRLPEAEGPRKGLTGSGPDLRLRIIGDSSAAGVGAATQNAALIGQTAAALASHFCVQWTLDAASGATSRSTLRRLATAPPAPTDAVILVLGVNDTTRLTPMKTWRQQQRALMDRVRTLYAPDRIYVTAIPPLAGFPLLPRPLRDVLHRHGRALDLARQSDLTRQPDATYVPFDLDLNPEFLATDRFHPSATLYGIWGQRMADLIRADWPPSRA